ncbi:MAG: hypothetical protein AAB225_26260 [Acidobacteriota bacterium]
MSRRLEWLGLTHRSGYRLMLERLAGGGDTEPLKLFADILEPVKGYARGRARKYTQQTPLNRLVDAARPESDTAREFARLVERGPAAWPDLRRQLVLWRDTTPRLMPTLERSFLLRETVPLAQDVAALAAAGLEAVDYLERREQAPQAWFQKRRELLERAGQPRAELLIMIVEPVRKLVEAAAAGSAYRSGPK